MLEIKIATKEDYPAVRDFYYSIIDAIADSPFGPGWERDIYPTQEFLIHSIGQGELYIGRLEGRIAACMVVNHEYNEGYRSVNWSVDAADSQLLVIHILGVHPDFRGKSFAKEMAQNVIALARKSGIKAIRLDVLSGNLPAERAYTKLGFQYVDTMRMFYEDTGWTDFRLFEYNI